jgi:hypothetical protein
MNIKREACRAVANAISENVPALNGKCDAGQADEEVLASYPSLRVIPRRFSFTPFEDEEIDLGSPTMQLVNLGDFEGQVELRIYELSQFKRGELEEAVLGYMMSTEGGSGSFFCRTAPLTLGLRDTLYSAPIIACLDDEDWREEMAFDKKRFSFLTLSVNYPALVVQDAPDILELYLAIARDLNATTPDETVLVDENGNYTKA